MATAVLVGLERHGRHSDRFHLIAPDYIGFGHSDAPSNIEFKYAFDSLTAHAAGLIDVLGLKPYIVHMQNYYMQNYGGPVGCRIFMARPGEVKGLVVQNATAYVEGIGDPLKQGLMPLWDKRNAMTEGPVQSDR